MQEKELDGCDHKHSEKEEEQGKPEQRSFFDCEKDEEAREKEDFQRNAKRKRNPGDDQAKSGFRNEQERKT